MIGYGSAWAKWSTTEAVGHDTPYTSVSTPMRSLSWAVDRAIRVASSMSSEGFDATLDWLRGVFQ